MRVAVIGVGGTGSAACRFLALAGHDVTGFEQFPMGHTRGSSHGASRIIRLTYPDPLYTRMMGDAYPLWEDLERETGQTLLERCGGLTFGPDGHPELTAIANALTRYGHPFTLLDTKQMRARYPALRLTAGEAAIFQPSGGFLRADRCVAANIQGARHRGADIREQVAIAGIEPQPSGGVVIVTENHERERYDRVIVTAGSWLTALFPDLSLPLTITRQQVIYLTPQPERRAEFASDQLPVWIDAETYWYGFPEDRTISGVKIARHVPGPLQNPEDPERPNDAESIVSAVDYATERLPGLTDKVSYATTCLYTNTPDEDFLIDLHPDCSDVLLVSGCSGHGFKFTVLLGRWAADWAATQRLPENAARFRRQRFIVPPVT